MSNIFNLKKKNKNKSIKKNEIYKGDFIGYIRHYLPANKEWFNSIYTYNKNYTKLLPSLDSLVILLIRSYFNMFNTKLEKKIKMSKLKIWKRRLSIRKIWVSKCELKHSNDKIIITLYIFNRQYNYLLKKISTIIFKYNLFNYFHTFKQQLKLLHIIKENININNILNINDNTWNYLKKAFITKYIKKYLKIIILYIKYKQIMLFNKYKYKDIYILPIKNIIGKIYNKKIEFNLVLLNNFYFNSDIFSQILTTKIKNRKNKALKVLKASIRKIKTPILNKKTIKREYTELIYIQNSRVNDFVYKSDINKYNNNNNLDEFLKSKLYYSNNSIDTQNTVINSIKLKKLSGIKIKVSGRITKRIIAARATYKLKYVGTLKNINSSYKGLPSILLRGNYKSNIQYTFLKSKTRIGSFGLKGWVSGY